VQFIPPERLEALLAKRSNRVVWLTEQEPASPITLAALCARTRMNRNKLHFGFKQQFGVSIHEYQTERRMQAALSLLEMTDLSVGQIAERTGYGEPTNFTAAFKRHFAALPREVRASRKRI
jgi:AraC-like DNA-binding protein